ncbi:ribonuclease H-like domain-containing protein [Mycena haematopus]|nr:ribonuclease H-like domain-containing protein [Mycena haematopus]
MKFYAVRAGKQTGVFESWYIHIRKLRERRVSHRGRDECKSLVNGVGGAEYKSFPNRADAVAWQTGATATSLAKPTSASHDKGKKRTMPVEVDDESGWDVVYSDGACKGNGQLGSYAGIGVWWGEGDDRNIAERCPGDQTNNRAELIAILRVFETTEPSKKPLLIKTDSTYSIKCFTEWLPKWRQNGFLTSTKEPVKNLALIKYISAHLDDRARRGQKVRLQYVKGHAGITGNEGADAQANLGAQKPTKMERDWAELEAELRQRLETDFSGSDKPESVPPEVVGIAPGDIALDSGESPTKTRKTSHKPISSTTTPEPLKPSSPPAPQVPLNPVPQTVVQPSVPQFTAEDLAQYAAGLLDDDDLLADLSD